MDFVRNQKGHFINVDMQTCDPSPKINNLLSTNKWIGLQDQ